MLVRELDETGGVTSPRSTRGARCDSCPRSSSSLVVTLGAVFWLYAPIDRARHRR